LLSLLRTFSDGLVDAFRFRSSSPAQAAEGAAEKRRQATRVLFKAQPKPEQPKPEQAAGEPIGERTGGVRGAKPCSTVDHASGRKAANGHACNR
jgi:hypothetical protein